MTTPVQAAPQPQQQPSGLGNPALPLAVATVITGVATASLTVATGVAGLAVTYKLTTEAASALRDVLGLVTSYPPPLTGVIGDASRQVARLNTARRAQFAVAAATRLWHAGRDARAKGEPVLAAVARHLGTERRWYEMHQQAMWNRARAAGQVDLEAAVHGPLLGWNTVIDGHTSPECRAADGWNFYATAMPLIGFPGATHPHCRCFPSAPHPGGRLLPSRHGMFARAA
jgi:hypothetical protein